MAFKVFISHAEEDKNLAERIHSILERMGLGPYIYELYSEYGRDLDDIIRDKISECKHFVVLLTSNGIQSQWVNQEIGMAYALNRNIIPVVEKGTKSKGFIEFKLGLPYDPHTPEYSISLLIYRLRILMNPKRLQVECGACGHEFWGLLPEQDEVNKFIERGQYLSIPCEECEKEIWVNASTFEIIT